MITLICKHCGKKFEVHSYFKNQKYCSRKCYRISLDKGVKLICQYCGKGFRVPPSQKNQKYCSYRCYGIAQRVKKVKLICQTCGKEFEVPEYYKNQKYCSRECYYLSKVGSKASEEAKANMKGHSGVYERTEEYKKKLRKPHYGMRGKHYSKKHIENIAIGWEKRAESSSYPRNYLCPNFNLESIPIFKSLDKALHTRNRYGGTKAGEKKIGKYFVDYFNKKYQFIIEWDEDTNHHHYPEGYDAEKRKYILAKYPNYTYITIKQDRWFKKGNLTEEIADKIVDHILKKLKEGRCN